MVFRILRHLPTLCFVAMVSSAAAQTAQEEADKGFLTNLIEDNLSGAGRTVSIQGFSGALSSAASIDVLTIADDQGVWLTLEEVVLDWNRSALLRGRIEVEELSATQITIARPPTPDDTPPSPEARPFSLPELPVSISLGQLQIDRLTLGETFLGEPFVATITGSAALASGEGTVDINATRLDGKTGAFIVQGSYSNLTEVLGLNLDISEGPGGIAASALEIPGVPATALTVQGTGPLSDYAAAIALATQGEDRIRGDIRLNETDGTRQFTVDIGGDVSALLIPEYQAFFGPDLALVAKGIQRPDGRFDLTAFDLMGQSIQMTASAEIGATGWPERLSLRGNISSDAGPVLLPLAGPKTYVDRISLNLGFDASQSDDWSTAFDITGFSRPGLAISTITVNGGGTLVPARPDIDGQFSFDLGYSAAGLDLEDAGVSDALGRELSGVLTGNRTENGPFNLSRVTLDGPGIELVGDAMIQGSSNGFRTTSTVLLDLRDMGRFSALAGRDLGGDGELAILASVAPLDGMFDVVVTGMTNALSVADRRIDPLLAGAGDIAIAAVRDTDGARLRALTIETDSATITASADLTSGASRVDFDARINDVFVIDPALSGPATLDGVALRDTAGTTTFDVRVAAPGTSVTATGEAVPAGRGQTISAEVIADIDELADYADLIGRDIAGGITADLTGVILSDGLRFDLDLAAQTRDLKTGVAQLDPLLSGRGSIRLALAAPTASKYWVQDLAIRTAAMRLDADGAYDRRGPSDVQFDLRIAETADVVADLSGPVAVTGKGRLDARGAAAIDITGTGPGATFDLVATVADQTQDITGRLQAAVADLSVFRGLAAMPLAGAVELAATGTAQPDFSRFTGDVAVATSDFAIGNPTVDPLLAGSGGFTAQARMTDAGLQIERLTAQYANLQIDGALETLDGIGRGTFDARLRNLGIIVQGVSGPATARGQATMAADGNWTIDADATAPGATATLAALVLAETQEISGNAAVAIADLDAYRQIIGRPVSGGVRATVDGALLPDLSRFAADFDVETRDLSIGDPTTDQVLRGAGRMRASISQTAGGLAIRGFEATTPNVTITGGLDGGPGGTGRGSFDARLRDVAVLTDQLSGPVTAQGTAALNATGDWDINATGTGPGGINLRATGQYLSSAQLAMDVNGSMPLGLANAALAPRRVDGTAAFDLSVNGPAALSSVRGRVDLDGARITAPTVGMALTGTQGGITLTSGQAQIDLTTRVDSGGQIAVSGPVGLSGGFIADITARLLNVALRDPELYETTVDGQINLRGPLTGGARITGALTLGPAEIQVPSTGVGSLGDLPNVAHIGASSAVRQTLDRAGANTGGNTASATAGGTSGPVYPLDLTLNAPSRVFIRGRGLDAELGGSLQLTGTSASIVPIGQFNLIRGRLNILQQRFDLTEGRVSLQGDFDPFIRLIAATQARTGTQIQIIVDGPASAPEVTFQSSPELPQDEVLAQLIFGRNLSEISPLQAVQLAAAVGTLAGRGGGGLIDNFRQNLGLDDFDVTTDEDGNAAIRAGTYLSENVYTDVVINSEGETEINLNLDITNEVTAKGTVNADGETSIGIFFERDY